MDFQGKFENFRWLNENFAKEIELKFGNPIKLYKYLQETYKAKFLNQIQRSFSFPWDKRLMSCVKLKKMANSAWLYN